MDREHPFFDIEAQEGGNEVPETQPTVLTFEEEPCVIEPVAKAAMHEEPIKPNTNCSIPEFVFPHFGEGEPNPTPMPPFMQYEKGQKGAKFGIKMVAMCLVCALIGGIAGGILSQGADSLFSTAQFYEGDREATEITPVSIDTSKEMSIPELYATYVNSTVGITVDIVSTNFFGQTVTGAAAGSGFVVTEDGYIITNQHVVADSGAIKVTFADGTTYDAVLVGSEAENDIAVIKIDATGLTPVVLGDSDQMYVGEEVVTIGNPLGELTFSLSNGIISALNRSITVDTGTQMDMIQTNTTINSGNSGGALFNLYGEVIGIVTAKYGSSSTSSASIEGLGFAIPINNVKDMIADIIEKGYVSGKPFLGISVVDVDSAVQMYGIPLGAMVYYAPSSLCAGRYGIEEGDIITAIDGETVTCSDELITIKNTYAAGDEVTLTVYRSGEYLNITLILDEQTSDSDEILQSYIDKQSSSTRPQ